MINSVRNTVLSVLNKNNYGYISPSDFNLYAQQAQMEIYEEYFSSYNKVINAENARTAGTDYADIGKTIAEVMESFLVSKSLVPNTPSLFPTNSFFTPSETTTGDYAFLINKVLCYPEVLKSGDNTAVSAFRLIDATADFIAAGVSIGDIVSNQTTFKTTTVVSVVSAIQLALNEDIFTASPDKYSVFSQTSVAEAEKVSSGKITLLNMSSLTSPDNIYPAYTLEGNSLKVYPSYINRYGMVNATYFRYPLAPKWTYINLLSGEPVFDQSQSDYQDFELPLEDEFKLAMKILQYCGVSIREEQVVQYGVAQEQHEQPTFSQQN
jgi:hypothetical protein